MSRTTINLLILAAIGLTIAGGVALYVALYPEDLFADENGVPREGFRSHDQEVESWGSDITELGGGYREDGEYRLTIQENVWNDPRLIDGELDWWGYQNWSHNDAFRNMSASVDVRFVEGDSAAIACLGVRADPARISGPPGDLDDLRGVDRHSFNLCLSDYYGLYAWWEDRSSGIEGANAGDWYPEPDAGYAPMPLDEWNRLKIVARDESMWMFLNDEYVGSTAYPGPTRGAIGVRILVPQDTGATVAFRKLEVRRLGFF